MKVYTTEQLRNVSLSGHSGSGKTTLAEAMLFERKHIDRMGRTEDGNTQSDFLPEETRRHMSISSSILPVENNEVKINLVDLPGARDFVGDIKGGMRVTGGVVVLIDALSGVEVGTEFALEYAKEAELPVTFFVNKLDKENASFEGAMEMLREAIPGRLIEMTMPIGSQDSLSGVVDLIKMKAVIEKDGKVSREDIPGDLADKAKELHEAIADEAASDDESLAEKFLEGEELTHEEIIKGLKKGFVERSYFPVFCGSAVNAIGIQSIMDFIEIGFANPHEAHGIELVNKDTGEAHVEHFEENGDGTIIYVFKTISDKFGDHSFFKVVRGMVNKESTLRNMTTNKDERMGHVYVQRGKNHHEVGELHAGDLGAVTKMQNTHTDDTLVTDGVNEVVKKPAYPPLTVTMAIEAESRGDEDKLGEALKKLVDLDPTLQSDRDPVLHQTLVRGMGDMHLDVLHSRLENIQKIKSILKVPKTAYRETLQGSAEGMYRHKKQSGGRGQFGEVHIRVRPNTEGAGFEFNWKIVGGVIPTKYESAVRKGVEQALEKGIIAGYPVVDVVVECFDGKQHDVDSSDMAFMLAASQAFRQVAAEANPVILEPIFKLKTTVPDQYLGDIMGDISGKRGRILGQDMVGKKVIVEAQVPRAELYEYSKQLRSMTQGRGVFEIEFDHYERVPGDIQAKLTEDFKHPEEEH